MKYARPWKQLAFQGRKTYTYSSALLSSRLYCRPRNYTESAEPEVQFAGYTAGRELHPAPKKLQVAMLFLGTAVIIARPCMDVKGLSDECFDDRKAKKKACAGDALLTQADCEDDTD